MYVLLYPHMRMVHVCTFIRTMSVFALTDSHSKIFKVHFTNICDLAELY